MCWLKRGVTPPPHPNPRPLNSRTRAHAHNGMEAVKSLVEREGDYHWSDLVEANPSGPPRRINAGLNGTFNLPGVGYWRRAPKLKLEGWTKKEGEWQPIQSRAEVRRAHNVRGALLKWREKMMAGLRRASDVAGLYFSHLAVKPPDPVKTWRQKKLTLYSLWDLQVFNISFFLCVVLFPSLCKWCCTLSLMRRQTCL